MTTLSSIANSALSALNTYTVAISVTNTNISNAETKGYTRRQTVFESTGNGVDVSSIKRVYDAYLTNRLRTETTELGFYEAQQELLTSVEAVFNESGASGLNSFLSDFWNSWLNVVNDPSDSTARSALATAADTLADTLNAMSSDLSDIQDSINSAIENATGAINDLLQQIATLNQNIKEASAAGQDCNTDKDTLDSLVTELSSYIGINYHTDDMGQMNISLENGKPLVQGATAWRLSNQTNASTGLSDITWVSLGGTQTVITDKITSGQLGGYLEVRDDLIPSYQTSLDELAVTLISQVNALHETGYDLDGDTGVSFFTGTSASDIAVKSDILDDSDNIAASETAGGIPDDGSIASAIAELQDSLLFNSATSTANDFYAALVAEIGAKVSSVELKYEVRESLVNTCQSQRDSVSAVSTDEEMVNLTLYQYAYEAAAKVTSVIDEMMETIINI